MSLYENQFNYKCEPMICGNSVDISLKECPGTQVRADIVVQEYNIVHLWGQIKSSKGHPVAGALVKLVQVICSCHGEEYLGIAHTLSDCQGFYQFELNKSAQSAKYRVIVNRAEGYEADQDCIMSPCSCPSEKTPDRHYGSQHDCGCTTHSNCHNRPQQTLCIYEDYETPKCQDILCTNITRHSTYDYSCKPRRR